MRLKLFQRFVVCFLSFYVFSSALSSQFLDPYNVLGVRRAASTSEIKRAYKELAKRWHPDKNQSPEAERKFIQINQAYGLLSDPKRRQRYDRYGTTDENEGGRGGDGQFNPFADFFSGHFNFNSKPSFFAKHRIGQRMYETSLLEKSFFTPYLIFIYSDWCMLCMRAEGIWERVVNELEPLGYGIATVNSMRDGALIDKLRVSYEPSIVALVEGRPISFRNNVIELRAIIDFARQAIPSHLVTSLTDASFREWMDDNWRNENKISAIMCGPQERPRLRFLLAAMRYQSYASFGYVALKSLSTTSDFRATYGVSTSTKHVGGLETFMIFNERVDAPVVSIQAKEIGTENLISALESNKFLILPRLSSQTHFDDLCPPSSTSLSLLRHLCIILLVHAKTGSEEDVHLNGYREFVENFTLLHKNDAIRYTYVYEDRQRDFVNALVSASLNQDSGEEESTNNGDRRDVIVLWRTERQQARLELLRGIWSGHPDAINRSAEVLSAKIGTILHKGNDLLQRKVELNQLVDEHSPAWHRRIVAKLTNAWDTFVHHVGKEEFFPILSVVGTLAMMLVLGYCVSYVTEPSERSSHCYQRHQSGCSNKTSATGSDAAENELRISELNAHTYAEMVLEARPGVRTIVILVSEETKEILLRRFIQHLLPWNENNVSLGYVVLEKNFSWFRHLCSTDELETKLALQTAVGSVETVAGTVLSLNGYRRYFNIYCPEKTEPKKRRHSLAETSNRHFLGFDSSSSSDEDDAAKNRLKAIKSLRGLSSWLERLFEGCCQKFSLSEWPPMR